MDEQRQPRFDQQLLDHISHGRNVEAKSMLNRELARAHDDFGTLLHYAAHSDNAEIARELIEFGADVDGFNQRNETPLVLAVMDQSLNTVKVLLEANANIDVVSDRGESALRLLHDLYFSCCDPVVHDAFARRLKSETRSTDLLAERLIAAGCGMHHAVVWADVDLMKCMLDRGVEINSRGVHGWTALHSAAERNLSEMVDWLMSNGADANTLDESGSSALGISADRASKDALKTLLEHGADPNVAGSVDRTPLYAAYNCLQDDDGLTECIELLLQHGADFQSSDNLVQLFDFALDSNNSGNEANAFVLIEQLAVLETLGHQSINKSVMYSLNEKYDGELSEYVKHFELCLQILKLEVFGGLSVFDLLQANENKMRLLVRKETFVFEVEKACSGHKLNELYSFYYNTLMMRIAKARRAVELEDEAIPVICKLFKGEYNQCYSFARRVVGYLSVRDLNRLVQV